VFRISRRLDYGLQLMVKLASDPDNTAQPTALMAESLQIPLPFLHQIGHTLMQAGLIKATPGPRGGLRLSRPAEEISVLQISEALEGNLVINECLDCATPCMRQEECTAQYMWGDLQAMMIKYLEGVNLQMLIDAPTKSSLFSLQIGQTVERD